MKDKDYVIPHKKTINGHVCINVRVPITFTIDVEDVLYSHDIDENGNIFEHEHYEEMYEYGPEVCEQDPYVKDVMNKIIEIPNCEIEDIIIEEC